MLKKGKSADATTNQENSKHKNTYKNLIRNWIWKNISTYWISYIIVLDEAKYNTISRIWGKFYLLATLTRIDMSGILASKSSNVLMSSFSQCRVVGSANSSSTPSPPESEKNVICNFVSFLTFPASQKMFPLWIPIVLIY